MYLLCLSAFAQTPLEMSSWDYPGVIDTDGRGYATLELVKNTMNKKLRFAGEDLAWGEPILVEGRQSVALRSGAASGDRRYVWVAADANGVLVQLDPTGAETGRRVFPMPNHRSNEAAMYPTDDGGLILVTQTKVKKIGKVVDVERIDKDLKTVWHQPLQVEKKGLKLLDSDQAGDRVVVLARGMNKAQEVIATDTSGKQVYRITLDGGDRKLDAKQVAVAANGTVGVFGEWTGTGAVREIDKPGQYFFAVVDPSGKATIETSTWEPSALGVTRTGASNTDAKLHIHDLVAAGDGFRLLGETYTWTGDTIQLAGQGATSQTQPTPFDVYDVAVVDFDASAMVSKVHKLHQPTKRTTIRAFGSGMSSMLEPYGRLGYRGFDGAKLLLAHDDRNVLTVSCVEPTEDHVPFDARQWVGLHTLEGQGAKADSWSVTYAATGTDNDNGNITLLDTDVLPASGGGFVVAHLSGGKLSLERHSCEDARRDDLLQGLSKLGDTPSAFPGGGAYALYPREPAEDGFERYQLVIDDGQRVHQEDLELPSSRVATVHNDNSVLQVNRDGSVHHLARMERAGGVRTATLDLSGEGISGATYAGAGDAFVLATRFRDGERHSYVVDWLGQDFQVTSSSERVEGSGTLSLRPLGGTATHVAFEESWRQPGGQTTRVLRVFDTTGKSTDTISGGASTQAALNGAGLVSTRWQGPHHVVRAIDGRGAVTLDGPTLESALGMPGLAAALDDDTLRLRLLDIAPVNGRTFVVGELLKGATDSDEQAGWATDFVVLEMSSKGKLSLAGGTLVPVTPSAARGRYRGIAPNGDDVELVFLDLQQNQWVASAALLSSPERRRFAPTALPPLLDEAPASGATLAFVEKLDRVATGYERGVKRLEQLLGSKAPPAPPAIDPATRVIPMGQGMVRVVHHRPDWNIAQWETLRLQ